MNSNDAVIAVVDVLNGANVAYMLVGAYSCNVYGVPRATRDADFVVQLDVRAFADIRLRLEKAFKFDPQIAFETVTGTTKHILYFKEHPFRVELFELSNDEHDQERFTRRRQITEWDRRLFVPTPEDVIVTKLRWSRRGQRSKDVDDVRNVIAVQGEELDWDYIHRWCDEHGTRELLGEIRDSIPEI